MRALTLASPALPPEGEVGQGTEGGLVSLLFLMLILSTHKELPHQGPRRGSGRFGHRGTGQHAGQFFFAIGGV